MAKKSSTRVQFDPGAGEFRELSPYAPRSLAEIYALQHQLGIARPPTGITTRPSVLDYIATSGSGSGWGTHVYGESKITGKGKDRKVVTWGIPVGLLAILLAIWELDRVVATIANSFGSAGAAVGNVGQNLAGFGSWIGSNVTKDLQNIGGTVASAAFSGVGAVVGSVAQPNPCKFGMGYFDQFAPGGPNWVCFFGRA